MKKTLCFMLCCLFIVGLTACEKFDDNYGKSSSQKQNASSNSDTKTESITIPQIKSDDDIMPTYLDISLYDEENYADIYLGKDFKYKITYVGSVLEVPSSYKAMTKNGWILDSEEYFEDAQVLAGKTLTVDFKNEYNKKITAVFFNDKRSSVSLKKCPIVKFIIKENGALIPKSDYDQFWINGVSNVSAITDIIECLGSPSHFYNVGENKYYLDWFITENDRRSGITIYIDTAEDHIDSIEFSYY